MFILEKIKKEISQAINQALGQDLVQPTDLAYPPNEEFGDLSLNIFFLIKPLGKSPKEIADKIVKEIKLTAIVKRVASIGSFVNFFIDKQRLAIDLLPQIDDDYGTNDDGQGKKVMIEYSNVNTHKEYHVGHLRNIVYGDAIDRLLLTNGYDAMPVTYINDFGIHTAKTLWALKKQTDLSADQNQGRQLGQFYVQAIKELKDNEVGQQEVSKIMQNIESGQGQDYELWQKTRQWSLDYFQSIYTKLKIKFERSYYESQQTVRGLKLVEELKAKGILQTSQGAVIADLQTYGLGVLVIIRSDNTALYPVADLALAEVKFKERLSQSIYIVDNRQSLYFQQLFKILELMGHQEKMIHLQYDFVKLPSGMMSSRSGNTISFEELYEAVLEKIKQETKNRHEDWPAEKIEQTAEVLAISILKWEMLKVSANKIIAFDLQEATRFDGFTAVYAQYAQVRINSILRQQPQSNNTDYSQLIEPLEIELAWQLAKYPAVVRQAAQKYEPSLLVRYLWELAKTFNDYYHQVPVLKSAVKIKTARLALLAKVRQVIINGSDLLGIANVEEM